MMEYKPSEIQNLSLDTPSLVEHRRLEREFASSRYAQERLVAQWQSETEAIVKEICPLDFFPQKFQIVSLEQLQVILAREGFPRRYEHYRFGQNYASQSVRDTYGLGRTYELVINTDPCVAYLLDTNSVMETRLVIAHVYFHNIFFKHNAFFNGTDRSMLDTMGGHAERIKRYQHEHGQWAVEKFIDICHSLSNLIDIHSVGIKRPSEDWTNSSLFDSNPSNPITPTRFDVPEYLDRHINPPELLEAQVKREKAALEKVRRTIPSHPQQDILLFLMKHAPIDDWHRDVLSIIRDEAYYFAPQGMTKIMNEGWASYWHSKIMTENLLPNYPSEVVDYCDFNASILAPWGKQGINPYRLGVRLLRDIEDRWNKGKFGDEWESCRDMDQRRNWDKKLGQGLNKICEAMMTHNDLTFLYNYLTPEFCVENGFHVTQRDDEGNVYMTSSEFEQVRQQLIGSLANLGQPKLQVVNSDHERRGELVIRHEFDERTLDLDLAEPTCVNLYKIWGRRVTVLTRDEDGQPLVISYDGKIFEQDTADPDYLSYFEDGE